MKSEKSCGTVGYRMHVVARDAAELAANAGGLIVDRTMSGWRVTVALSDAADVRPLQILGAELVDEATSPGHPDEEQCVLVMGADAYAKVLSDDGRQLPAGPEPRFRTQLERRRSGIQIPGGRCGPPSG
jgi:hypothetical protein